MGNSMKEPATGDQFTSSSFVTFEIKYRQKRRLPLMIWMVVGLTLFFFIASFAQLIFLHVNIRQPPEVNQDLTVPKLDLASNKSPLTADLFRREAIAQCVFHKKFNNWNNGNPIHLWNCDCRISPNENLENQHNDC